MASLMPLAVSCLATLLAGLREIAVRSQESLRVARLLREMTLEAKTCQPRVSFGGRVLGDKGLEVPHPAGLPEQHVHQPQQHERLAAVGLGGGNENSFCYARVNVGAGAGFGAGLSLRYKRV